MDTLQEYKCPCCGGAIAFDSTLQKMKCPFCDTEFELEALKSYDAELKGEQADNMTWDTSAGTEWNDGETDGLRSYVCKSCGGEIVGDAVGVAVGVAVGFEISVYSAVMVTSDAGIVKV